MPPGGLWGLLEEGTGCPNDGMIGPVGRVLTLVTGCRGQPAPCSCLRATRMMSSYRPSRGAWAEVVRGVFPGNPGQDVRRLMRCGESSILLLK